MSEISDRTAKILLDGAVQCATLIKVKNSTGAKTGLIESLRGQDQTLGDIQSRCSREYQTLIASARKEFVILLKQQGHTEH